MSFCCFLTRYFKVNSFQLGAFSTTSIVVQVWDLANPATPVFSSSQSLGATITLSGPWTSAVGLVIQVGPDALNVGIDNVSYDFISYGVE